MTSQQQAAVKKLNSKGPTPSSLIGVDIPAYKRQLIGRNDEIGDLISNLKQLAESPEKGFLFVTGPSGVGKSMLVAHVFNDAAIREKLATDCHLHIAMWLNCAKFRRIKFAETHFGERIARSARRVAGDNPPAGAFSSLPAIIHFFERQKRLRLLFILDNITFAMANILEFMARSKSSCVVICDNDEDDPTTSFRAALIRQPVFFVDRLSDIAMPSFFDVSLKNSLPPPQRAELVRCCRGLPLLASLINGRCRIDHGDNCRAVCEDIIDQGDKLTVSSLVTSGLDKLTDLQLGKLCSFLFHGTEEPISQIDIAMLWGCDSIEMAEAQCREFEAMSLLNRMHPPSLIDNPKNEKADRFVLHSTVRLAALDASPKLKNFLEKNPLRLSGAPLLVAVKMGIVSAKSPDLPKIDPDQSIMKLLKAAISQERLRFWEKLLRHPVVANFIHEKYPGASRLCDHDGRSTLILASRMGNLELVKRVYELNPEAIKLADKIYGRLPLVWAVASHAPLDVVTFLYDKYPDAIRCRDLQHGQTVLNLAVEYGRLDVTKFLYEKFREAIQIDDDVRRVPLSVAAQIGRLDLVKMLFEKYPEAVESTMPLRLAAEYGHLPIVRFLLSQYPQAATIADEVGLKPADRASMNGHSDVAEFLQKQI